MVGSQAEQQGIAKHGAKMVMAMSMPVKKIAIITGGSFAATMPCVAAPLNLTF